MEKQNEIVLNVSPEYSYLLERYYFEYNRAIQNVVFLLNKHLDNVLFLHSDIFKKTYEKAVQNRANLWSYQHAVINLLLEQSNCDKGYKDFVLISEHNRITKIKVIY